MAERQARRFHVTGVVQGVGFRYFTVLKARSLRLDGWVRNEDDGSVLAEAAGDPEALARLGDLLHQGPPAAQVARVDISDADSAPRAGSGFDVRQ